MAGIKSLFKDTAVYGMSSIVGRFLNWCLVPMYTYCFTQAQYGVVTLIYAAVAVALIVLIYGMETGFFRFANHERWSSPGQVYTTALTSIAVTSTAFIALGCVFSPTLAEWALCPAHPSFIWLMVVAVGVDAFTALPFAYLRYKNRSIRFATLKLINIGLNIGLNLLFIIACPAIAAKAPDLMGWYDPSYGVGYIFLANFIASLATLLMVIPELTAEHWSFNRRLLGEMLRYSFPLLVLGLAGIMNQSIDKILYPILAPDKATATEELGVYGACYKIAIVMVMFIQAFRFAYEPFIFARSRDKGESRNDSYVSAMNWFVIFAMIIFLGVMYYLPVLRYFIKPSYFSGLKVVPIIMMAEFFFGVFFNLSLWYKLTDRTIWGTWFSLLGLAVTLGVNIAFVPHFGYMACAWAAFTCYAVMMTTSWLVGRRKMPIGYNTGRIIFYVVTAMVLWQVADLITTDNNYINFPTRFLLLMTYGGICWITERRGRRRAACRNVSAATAPEDTPPLPTPIPPITDPDDEDSAD